MKKIKHNVIFDSLTHEIKIPDVLTIDPVRLQLERRLRKLQQRNRKKGRWAYRRILQIKEELHISLTDEEKRAIEKLFKKLPVSPVCKNRKKAYESKRRAAVLKDLHSPETQKAAVERERIRKERLGVSVVNQKIVDERKRKEFERQRIMAAVREKKFSKGHGNGPTLLSIKL